MLIGKPQNHARINTILPFLLTLCSTEAQVWRAPIDGLVPTAESMERESQSTRQDYSANKSRTESDIYSENQLADLLRANNQLREGYLDLTRVERRMETNKIAMFIAKTSSQAYYAPTINYARDIWI